jgi:hypothetical protein
MERQRKVSVKNSGLKYAGHIAGKEEAGNVLYRI